MILNGEDNKRPCNPLKCDYTVTRISRINKGTKIDMGVAVC